MVEFLLALAAAALASRWLLACAASLGIPSVVVSMLTMLV